MATEKNTVSLYLDTTTRKEIESFFLDCRIKNFQKGYREIITLGFKEFKKQQQGRNKNSK
jgi:hypothetical protein